MGGWRPRQVRAWVVPGGLGCPGRGVGECDARGSCRHPDRASRGPGTARGGHPPTPDRGRPDGPGPSVARRIWSRSRSNCPRPTLPPRRGHGSAPPPSPIVTELRADGPAIIPPATDVPVLAHIPPALDLSAPAEPIIPPAIEILPPAEKPPVSTPNLLPVAAMMPPMPTVPATTADVNVPKVRSVVPTVAAATKPAPGPAMLADVATAKAAPEPTPVRAEVPPPPRLSLGVPNRPAGR